jgi:serine/threonine protein kinase
LHERLGKGGNAKVWRATDSGGREVALKVIDAIHEQREQYKRFVREIEFLRSVEDTTGVLPLIDAHLPDAPSEDDRPWLAMPIATPITDALHDQPLETVVEALATVATTLARLHGDGIGHRDVKPGNLYLLGGGWLVGDFGLVSVPDVEELTQSGRPLGPAHFTPYEMISNPDSADPKPADVYSLAKTLWVLATDQRFPPEGHQPSGARGFGVNDFRPHPNAYLLDALIDRSTRIHPAERPTMAEFADDLRRWLLLPEETKAIDIGDIRTRFRSKMDAKFAEEDLAAQREELARAAVRRLAELISPLNQALRDLHPRATVDGGPDEFTRNIVRTIDDTFGSPEIAFRYQRLSSIEVGERGSEFRLRFARTVELEATGDLILHLAITVGHDTMGGLSFRWLPDAWSAPVGSVEAEEQMRSAVSEAAVKLREAAEAFTEGLP